jgi:hypothetical protein
MGPGANHDSGLYNESSLCKYFASVYTELYYLLADSGYALSPFSQVPFSNLILSQSPAALRMAMLLMNSFHRTMRNVVERFNGVLKSRFRVLLYGGFFKTYETYVLVVQVCIILHNICMIARLPPVSASDIDPAQLSNPNAADHPPTQVLADGAVAAAIQGVSTAASAAFFEQHSAVHAAKLTKAKDAGKLRRAGIFRDMVTTAVHTASNAAAGV